MLDIKTYKIWMLAGDPMRIVQTMDTWEARAIEQADFLTNEINKTHVAVVSGSDYDMSLIEERRRKAQSGLNPW